MMMFNIDLILLSHGWHYSKHQTKHRLSCGLEVVEGNKRLKKYTKEYYEYGIIIKRSSGINYRYHTSHSPKTGTKKTQKVQKKRLGQKNAEKDRDYRKKDRRKL